jgi:hypothetical protein
VETDLRWVVAADLTGAATLGQTIATSLCQASGVVGVGQLTNQPLNFVIGNPAPVGATYTLPEPTPTPLPNDNAAAVSHTIPSEMATNNIVPVQITLTNTGNTTWSAADGFALAVTSDSCALSNVSQFAMDPGASIAPGSNYTFSVSLRGAATAGSCSISLRMIQATRGGFGDSIVASVAVVTAQQNAVLVAHTIPENLAPGEGVGVGITMRNTGNTVWTRDGNYLLYIQSDPCATMVSPGAEMQPGEAVMPGQTYQFLAYITAPATPQSCAIQLQTAQRYVEAFGDLLNVSISVAPRPNAVEGWEAYE